MTEEVEKTALEKTQEQMLAAPRGALFIWWEDNLWEPRKLAERIKRSDLVIVGPAVFNNKGYRLRGNYVPVILDHSTVLSAEHQDVLDKWRAAGEAKTK